MADVPLLRAITETFGANMWFNTIVALTHAAAAPPDGNNGPLTYDTYTRTRTQLLQQNIRWACVTTSLSSGLSSILVLSIEMVSPTSTLLLPCCKHQMFIFCGVVLLLLSGGCLPFEILLQPMIVALHLLLLSKR